jgi:hypothetical protein
VVGSFSSVPAANKLPNNSNDPLKGIHPSRPPTCLWPLRFLTSRSAEMSTVTVATCLPSRQMPNPLSHSHHSPHSPHRLISLPYYRSIRLTHSNHMLHRPSLLIPKHMPTTLHQIDTVLRRRNLFLQAGRPRNILSIRTGIRHTRKHTRSCIGMAICL